MRQPLRAALMCCLTAASIAIGGSSASEAQVLKFEWGDSDFNVNLWPACLYDQPKASHYAIRQNARGAGYRRIRAIAYHDRKFNKQHRCGFYRAEATRGGRNFTLYFDADSGALLSVRQLGRATGKAKFLNERQIERRVSRRGWTHIRNLHFVDRGRNEFYVMRARRNGAVYRLRVDAKTGKVKRTKRLTAERASKKDVRKNLRQHGYRKIRNLRFVDRGAKEYWVARAAKGDREFRVFAEVDTGKPYRRVRLDTDRASKADARQTLRAAGYRNIRNLRFVDRGKRQLYVARARRGGRDHRVFLDAEDAELLRSERVN